MPPAELISTARIAVGDWEEDDYVIDPAGHASRLTGPAPSLAGLLGSSGLTAIARQYTTHDKAAVEAQRAFKRAAVRANWAVLLAAVFSALLLMTVPLSARLPADAGKGLYIAFGVGGASTGALAGMWLFQIREGELLKRWLTARARAEADRLRYFDAVTAPVAVAPALLSLLQLEYFRRYQFDVQRAFYRRRGADHQRAADRALARRAAAAFLATFAAGVGGVLGGAVDAAWVSLAGFGVIATALAGFAAAQEGINQDRRNAERYGQTLEALEQLDAQLDAVRELAAGGDGTAVGAFVAQVHERLMAEHRQWLEASEAIAKYVGELDAALAKLRAKPQAEKGSRGPTA